MDQNQFTTTTNRIMEVLEVEAKVAEMKLSDPVKKFICEEFERVHMGLDIAEEFGSCHFEAIDSDRITGENGRIAYGQSWESVMEDLGKVMGYTQDDIWNKDIPEDLRRIYNTFFEE